QGAVVGEVGAGRDTGAVDGGDLGGELRAVLTALCGEGAGDVPVVGGDEGHPLALALDHQTGGDGLDAAGRQGRLDLAPQHRGELEAHQAVQDAAGLLRVDQARVDVAGVLP